MSDQLYTLFKSSTGVCTDTRKIAKGNIFFALKGPNFNGNAYAKQALEQGAAYAVIDEKEYATDSRFIVVDEVLSSLQKLARTHRDTLNIPFIGITGSNGKTTTKELIYAVLSQKYKTFATQGNLNNHIGVPLTLLSITSDIEMAVIELGANHIGEIETLCEIANPSHGLITNIGMDHLEGYGNIEGVAKGNSELFYHLLKTKGTVFVNSKDELLMRMAGRFEKPVLYPQKGNYYYAAIASQDFFINITTETGKTFATQLIGEYNFDNAAIALCLGKFFNVPEEKSIEAIASYAPKNNRSQIVTKGTNTLILDAYNANPSSMGLSVQNFAKMAAPQKAVILGDMFELGDFSKTEHRKMIELAQDLPIQQTIFCGTEFSKEKKESDRGLFFKERADLSNWLKQNPFSDYFILFKGSRGMALEKLLDDFE